MKNAGLKAVIIGAALNFALVVTKFYVGISCNSLTVYCDAVNNLADIFACVIAFFGFSAVKKLTDEQKGRAQSLCTFVINIFVAVTGVYFVYGGAERLLYPLPVAYSMRYVVILAATIGVKIIMGVMYKAFNKNLNSSVLRALVLDSFLDCFVTLASLMTLVLVSKVRFAVDGVFAIVTGGLISAVAIKGIITETKNLIYNQTGE